MLPTARRSPERRVPVKARLHYPAWKGLDIEIPGLIVLAALAWFWLHSLKARELAIRTARIACEAEGLLLLDFTVAIARLSLGRDEHGRVRIRRVYDFEYSDTGDNRRKGNVVLLGHSVVLFSLGRDTSGRTVIPFPGSR